MHRQDRRYRVVFREGTYVRAFGTVDGGAVSYRTLDPFLSRLRLAGVECGEPVLVDSAGGYVARRLVRPPRPG
ncbi:MAG TPA: hypothetical protein VH482_20070 [Thermomicrobiales bacterium]|jgi:hypothetical protein